MSQSDDVIVYRKYFYNILFFDSRNNLNSKLNCTLYEIQHEQWRIKGKDLWSP